MTVSLEDYTTLWGWITFSWVWPLVKRVRARRASVLIMREIEVFVRVPILR
jgi:hypothetical protein